MNLSEEEIIEIIKTYYSDVNSQNAILLNGEWGCGKTYFVKNKILAEINDSVYVSLYGLSNTNDISNRILSSIMNKNMKINKKIKKARSDSNEIKKKTIAKAVKTCLIEESEYVNYCSSIDGLAGLGNLDEFEDPFDKENSSISDLDTKYSITVENNEKINVEYLGAINDKYKIGDKVCINNECLYVIIESETEVTVLSVHAIDVS